MEDKVLWFGKYRGDHISAIPTDYLRWMLRQSFPDEVVAMVKDELAKRPVKKRRRKGTRPLPSIGYLGDGKWAKYE